MRGLQKLTEASAPRWGWCTAPQLQYEMESDWDLSFEAMDALESSAWERLAERRASGAHVSTAPDYQQNLGGGSQGPVSQASYGRGPIGEHNPVSRGSQPAPQVVTVMKYGPGTIAAKTMFNKQVVTTFKAVFGHEWNKEDRVWTFPEEQSGHLFSALQSLQAALPLQVRATPPVVLPAGWAQPHATTACTEEAACGRTPGSPPSAAGRGSSQDDKLVQATPAQPCGVRVNLSRMALSTSEERVEITFDYHELLVAAIRSVPGALWEKERRTWTIPLGSLRAAKDALTSLPGLTVKFEGLDPLTEAALLATASRLDGDFEERYKQIPADFEEELMPFQREGIRYALRRGGRALIADEMGLGKTLQALGVVAAYREDWPVLVIVPSALRLQWAEAIRRWLKIPAAKVCVVVNKKHWQGFRVLNVERKASLELDGLFNVISYDLVGRLDTGSKFQVVVADESHYLKNPQAQRTKLCLPLLQAAKRCLLLTGTPALSRPIELFKQLEALQPQVYRRKMDAFGNLFCQGGKFGVHRGCSRKEELHALMRCSVMVRRVKAQVLKQLPAKRRERVKLSVSDAALGTVRLLFKELQELKQRSKRAGSDEGLTKSLHASEQALISQMYRESAVAKQEAVLEWLEPCLEADCKVLVFAHHTTMLDALSNFFKKKKVGFVRIDGHVASVKRLGLVKDFQEQKSIRMAVLGIKAAGVGYTLTQASTVVFAEMAWTPGDMVQAEDRAHRIGQESAVNVYYLHAQETVDDLIWEAIRHKLTNLGQVIDGTEGALGATESERAAPTGRRRTPAGGPQLTQGTLDSLLVPHTTRPLYSEIKDDEDTGDGSPRPAALELETDRDAGGSRSLSEHPCSSSHVEEEGLDVWAADFLDEDDGRPTDEPEPGASSGGLAAHKRLRTR